MTNAIYDKHHILLRIDYLGQTYYSTLSKIIFFPTKKKCITFVIWLKITFSFQSFVMFNLSTI